MLCLWGLESAVMIGCLVHFCCREAHVRVAPAPSLFALALEPLAILIGGSHEVEVRTFRGKDLPVCSFFFHHTDSLLRAALDLFDEFWNSREFVLIRINPHCSP